MRAVAAATLACLAAGCGGDAEPDRAERRDDAPSRATPPASRRAPPPRPARCPAGLAGCVAVTGRVLYVEAVDPDGDGDAHYVLAGGRVTFPGITVVDVRRGLRPRRLPRPGERVSAAGPVYRGSYGQRQIEAVTVHHERW